MIPYWVKIENWKGKYPPLLDGHSTFIFATVVITTGFYVMEKLFDMNNKGRHAMQIRGSQLVSHALNGTR